MTFGEKLQSLRKTNGYSQEKIAELLEVSRQSVSKWEVGESMPETNKIILLSKIFNVSIDYLLIDEEDTQPEDTKEEQSVEYNSFPHRRYGRQNNFRYFRHLIRKNGHIGGYIISAYGVLVLFVSRIAVYVSNQILGGYNNSYSGFFNSNFSFTNNQNLYNEYFGSSSSVFNPVAFVGNIMSAVGIILIIAGIIIANFLKNKRKK